MRYVMMAMFMVLTCLHMGMAQAVSPEERESLRGLPGVYVIIESIGKDAQADGLKEEAIRTAVELILRSSGIRVLTESEWLETPAAPYLYVRAATLKELVSGKGPRQISRELFISSQTINVIKKAMFENNYRSYLERSKKERKKKVYSIDRRPIRRKWPEGRPKRTKFGTIYVNY